METNKLLEKIVSHETARGLHLVAIASQAILVGFTTDLTPSSLQLARIIPASYLIIGGIKLYASAPDEVYQDKDGRMDGPSYLITDGIYDLLRHPAYSGLRMASLGFLLFNPTVENAAACGLVFLSTEATARLEEKRLGKMFGQEFLEYKQRVPRWMPNMSGIAQIYQNARNHVAGIIKKTREYCRNKPILFK